MRTSTYLIVTENGKVEQRSTDRFTLKPGEVAVKVVLNIPDEAFGPPPMPTVNIDVPAGLTFRNVEIAGEASV